MSEDHLERTGVSQREYDRLIWGVTGIDWSAGGGGYSYPPTATRFEILPASKRRNLLVEAADLVDGERNADYGDPNQDFKRTAEFWNTYLSGIEERTGSRTIEAQDVAWMMLLLKASRSTVSPAKRDHYVDAAGYAACGWDCADRSG